MTTTTMMMTLAQAHALLPGSTLIGNGATPLHRVHTDTRSLQAGDLFVALKGERFDAHDYLAQALASGAAAAIAERGLTQAGMPACGSPTPNRRSRNSPAHGASACTYR